MSDKEKVQQALAELWDVVKCRCNEAYTGRGLHDPDCECDSEGALQIVTGTIEALTEQLAAARDDAKEAEAYAGELEADRKKTYEALLKVSRIHGEVEAKLAKAVEALGAIVVDDTWGLDHDVYMMCRATLAEIKGESHE
jgi:hypothetical protein